MGKRSRARARNAIAPWTVEGALGLVVGLAGLALAGVRGLLVGLGIASFGVFLVVVRRPLAPNGRRSVRDARVAGLAVLTAALLFFGFGWDLVRSSSDSTQVRAAETAVYTELLAGDSLVLQATQDQQPLEASQLATSEYSRNSETLAGALSSAQYRLVYSFYNLAQQSHADPSYLAGSGGGANFRLLKSALAGALRALGSDVR